MVLLYDIHTGVRNSECISLFYKLISLFAERLNFFNFNRVLFALKEKFCGL